MPDLLPMPLLYPQKFDAAGDAIFFIRMDETGYRAASFLDDRMLAPGQGGEWPPFAGVAEAMRDAQGLKPLNFIFHTGHVGSTLLSRLIDETGEVLGLREPLPLRTLAEMADSGAPGFGERVGTFLALWRRGFARTRQVLLKATSTGGRIAPALLAASPDAKAVYLNLRLEPYLATILAGANAMVDLKGFEAERNARLRRLLDGTDVRAASPGELAAKTWLVESLTRARAVAAGGGRVMPLDFDAMLADLPKAMTDVLMHLGIVGPASFAQRIAHSPVLTRYSKAPQQFEYSPGFRAQLLAQARREHAAEIRKGLVLIDTLAKADPRVAALLG